MRGALIIAYTSSLRVSLPVLCCVGASDDNLASNREIRHGFVNEVGTVRLVCVRPTSDALRGGDSVTRTTALRGGTTRRSSDRTGVVEELPSGEGVSFVADDADVGESTPASSSALSRGPDAFEPHEDSHFRGAWIVRLLSG